MNSRDAKGHGGRIISLGRTGGPIYLKSQKQKLVARSSTEAELICLADAVVDVLWAIKIMRFLCIKIKPVTLLQDNKSTIFMAETGAGGRTGNSKHIDVRYFFAKQHIDNGDLKLEYLQTDAMLADFLTKPLQGRKFYEFRAKLLNLPEVTSLYASWL
jgi:hypothetical protein